MIVYNTGAPRVLTWLSQNTKCAAEEFRGCLGQSRTQTKKLDPQIPGVTTG